MLFTVPASAMINVRTLAQHYPSDPDGSPLSANQLISLHMMLYRPLDDGESSDSLFGPYISVLPRNFETHPMTWTVKQKLQQHDYGVSLIEHLTPSALAALDKVFQKFHDDWEAVRAYLVAFRALVRWGHH